MEATVNINQLIRDIDKLDYTMKLNVMSHIVTMLKKPEKTTSSNLSDLRGLGKELWLKTDVDDYLSKERDAWN
jgi:hypothetical protein